MKTIRIFISSPGDVAEEREMARQVVQGLRKRYASYFDLQPVLWEYLPLQADASFQQGVDLVISADHGVDISVFILWSRLGSPLGALIRKDDGSEYRSGTEREFDLMLKAREATGGARPHLLVYTRDDEAGFRERVRLSKPEEKKTLLQQKGLVTTFIREEFHDRECGTNVRAYHTFNQATSFSSRLRAHLQGLLDTMCEGLRADPVWDIDEKGPPFRGLSVFEFEHADVFFGREDEIVAARTALLEGAKNGCAFLLVTGASGAGKSSLARAGILPAVVENEIDDSVASWRKAVFSPTELEGDICQGIASALIRALPELNDSCGQTTLASEFAEDTGRTVSGRILPALQKASADRKGAVRLILLADQLEELFTDERLDAAKREQLGEILQALARSGEIWVVATIRGDFYARSMEVAALMQLKADGAQIDVLPPKADAIRRMIESPAAVAGLSYERTANATLADTILSEASNQGELLPLLQDLLEGLFRKRSTEGVLTSKSYSDLGGISGALAKRAEDAFTKLPPETQAALPDLLRQLVRLDETGEEARGATKRRAPLSSFPEGTASRSLADALVSERLLVADQTDQGDAVLSVVHEALLRVWPRVATWIEDNREFLRQRARLSQALAEWQAQDRHHDYLLMRGLQLVQAEELLRHHGEILTNEERAFIGESQAKAEKDRRRASRIRTAILSAAALLVLLALAGGAAGYVKNSEAKRERLAAETRQRQADSYYRVHSAQVAAEQGDFRGALEHSLEGYETHKDFTTRSALITALRNSPQRLETSVTDFGAAVTSLAFSKDGTLAAADAGGSMRVIDLSSRPMILSAAYVSDAKDAPMVRALSTKEDHWVGWREDGTIIKPGTGSEDISLSGIPFLQISLSASGDLSAAVFPEAPTQAVVRQAGQDRQDLARVVAESRIRVVCVSDSGQLAAATANGELILGSNLQGEQVTVLQETEGGQASCLSWEPGPDGRLAVGTSGGEVIVITPHADENAKVRRVKIQSRITALAWTDDGERLAAARSDGSVSLLECVTDREPREIETLNGHAGPVLALAWSADGKVLASGGEDETVCIWTPESLPSPIRSIATGRDLRGMAISHDASRLALGANDGSILAVPARTLTDFQLLGAQRSAVGALDWDKSGNLLASGSVGGQLDVWQLDNGQPVSEFPVPGSAFDKTVWRVKWSPSSPVIAFTSHSGTVGIVDTGKKEQFELGILEDYALGLAWTPDGSKLAVGSTDGRIRVWRFADRLLESTFPDDKKDGHTDSIGSLAFSPDGKFIGSCGNDGVVVIWDFSATKPIARSAAAGCYLEDLTFSPGGEYVGAVGADGYLRVWSAPSMEPWFAVKSSDKHLWAMSWKGENLFLAGTDGRVTAIDTRDSVWKNRAHEIIGKNISR